MDLMRAADLTWPLLWRVLDVHGRVYKASGGRLGHRIPLLPPMLLLEHVGAKSGVKRSTPLVYAEDGEDIVLVASKGGYERNPAWFHNLRANPDVTVQLGTERRAVRARVATAAERGRLWQKAVAVWPGYRGYQRRTKREIPLLVLEPRADPA